MSRRFPLLASAIALASAGTIGYAQEVKKLDTVVVTASGFEQNIADAPASISVITREDLEKQSYTTVLDAVENIPGVYTTGGGGAQDVSIRGMSQSYTLYLIDGRPVSAGRSVNTNGQDSGKQIALPPLSMIERIEVIRGPMSSLYGSEAMGGVINIITRKTGDEWSGSITSEFTKSLNDVNNDSQHTNLFAGGPLIPGLLSAQVNGSWSGDDESDFAGADDNARSTPESKRKQGGVKLILTPDERNEIALSYDAARLEETSTPGKSVATDATGSTYRYDKDVYVLSHRGNYGNWVLDSYLQHDISEKVQDDTKKEEVTIFDTHATYFMSNHVLTFGGRYKYEDFTDETNGLLSANIPGAVKSVDRWIAALYLEADWGLTDNLSVTTGLRYDDDELFGGHLSPRVYAVYQASPQWIFKGGVSTGYRQPSLSDATEGFGRGTGGGGSPAPHPRALIIGNPDLDPETSINYEIGAVFTAENIDLTSSIMLFQTEFKDKIAEKDVCTSPGYDRDDTSTWSCEHGVNTYGFLRTRVNVDDAEMHGVEWTLKYGITQDVSLSASYTYTDSEQKTGEFKGQPLNKTPKHMANALLDWQANDRLSLWLQGNYRSETSDFLSRTSMSDGTPGYGLMDAGLVYRLNNQATVKAGVYNLANKEITNDDYGVVLDGRQINLGLTVDF